MFNPYSDLSEKDQLTKQDIIDMWVYELENFPERQTRCVLERQNGQRCCLGELCHIASLFGVCKKTTLNNNIGNGFVTYDNRSVHMPKSVFNWVGLSDYIGQYEKDDIIRCLAQDNDDGMTWPQIAEIIKNRPAGLFNW